MKNINIYKYNHKIEVLGGGSNSLKLGGSN